jgi:hypothetical protein
MKKADEAWNAYEESRSTSFTQALAKYRMKHGRHPPPGFRDWYKFARERNVHNIDDFDQIMDDLRPFWGVEPAVIRHLAAHMGDNKEAGLSGLHIRNKTVWSITNMNWRIETFSQMVMPFIEYLPDMDIALNVLDQPRVVVPWDDMQALLATEVQSRRMVIDSPAEWTTGMAGFLGGSDTASVQVDPEFFWAPGQQYMLLAKEACPPNSHARTSTGSDSSVEALYKDPQGGFITNFNLSSDLCAVGPEVQDKHGFLFASSTVIASRRLLPIFGECKVNVNSDILFPANMYYKKDDRYQYNPEHDYGWDDKEDIMLWRGVTSGGTNTADNYKNMQRQRLTLFTNGTIMANNDVRIMSQSIGTKGVYENFPNFHPAEFANKHTDVGFTEPIACVPNCEFYNDVWTYKNMTTLTQQFENKYLVDIDGHSFSGRWHAFVQSKSLGIKSTIFREWHDSRLFAWRHFVPLDNRFDELYSILTYFIGLGNPADPDKNGAPYVQRHDFEARKLGRQGQEWASKVLRREDIEVSLPLKGYIFQETDACLDIPFPSPN